MASFSWTECNLSADCPNLVSMAIRFEETAKLLRELAKDGFQLEATEQSRHIVHPNPKTFESWGFIEDENVEHLNKKMV